MKNLTIIIVATTILLLFFAGCDKYHRNRYVGDWEFVTERTFYNRIDNSYDFEGAKTETIYYLGKISKDNEYDEYLTIRYDEYDEVTVLLEKIDKKVFLRSGLGATAGKYPCGEFEDKDKVSLMLYRGIFSPMKYPYDRSIEYIVGTKKKGGKK